MEQAEGIKLWKRAWRMPDGTVHSTRPYASEEELLRSESAGPCHGNEWCGEPFSFIADNSALSDYMKYGSEPEEA